LNTSAHLKKRCFCGKYADVQALPSELRVDVTETAVTRTRLNPDGHVTRFGDQYSAIWIPGS
jgi:hypothetical protein